jgi:hypothetical protein
VHICTITKQAAEIRIHALKSIARLHENVSINL